MIIINHLGGIRALNHCKISGMFSMGKINPDNRMVGNIKEKRDINMAICWVFAMVEIQSPMDNARKIYKILTVNNRTRLPTTGTWKTKFPSRIMLTALIKDRTI